MTAPLTGGCRCRAIRYAVTGAPFNATICHCLDCRHAAGAPCVAWFSVRADAFGFTAGEPIVYASSEKGRRGFCAVCGTPVTFRHADHPDEVDVTTCSLDDPEHVPPRDHVRTGRGLSWMQGNDGLPRHRATRGG